MVSLDENGCMYAFEERKQQVSNAIAQIIRRPWERLTNLKKKHLEEEIGETERERGGEREI